MAPADSLIFFHHVLSKYYFFSQNDKIVPFVNHILFVRVSYIFSKQEFFLEVLKLTDYERFM